MHSLLKIYLNLHWLSFHICWLSLSWWGRSAHTSCTEHTNNWDLTMLTFLALLTLLALLSLLNSAAAFCSFYAQPFPLLLAPKLPNSSKWVEKATECSCKVWQLVYPAAETAWSSKWSVAGKGISTGWSKAEIQRVTWGAQRCQQQWCTQQQQQEGGEGGRKAAGGS